MIKDMLAYRKQEAILGIVLLLAGCSIYLLFRSTSIKLYKWCIAIGMSDVLDSMRENVKYWRVPDFVLYSLPDGLYCTSYILIMDALWHDSRSFGKHLIIILVPLIACFHELAQGAGIAKGTFDNVDIVCYVIPIVVYMLYYIKKLNN